MPPKVIVIMPAYNAEKTLQKTFEDIPKDKVDEIILGDDCSSDRTVEIATSLGIRVLKTPKNMGYGGNQKMLYREALAQGADIIVMLHPDWQYDAAKIPALIDPILKGEKDLMLGSRILSGAGGMPFYKLISNRFLTWVENLAFQLNLSEYHTGFRAFSRKVLATIPFEKNSNDFVFDTEVLAKAAACGFRAGEISVPCRYFSEASEINFWRSAVYGLQTLFCCANFLCNKFKPKPKKHGFTIIELVIVMTVIVLLSLMSLFSTNSYKTLKLDAAAKKMGSDINYARNLAISMAGWYGASVETDTVNNYSVYQTDGATDTLVENPSEMGKALSINISNSFGGVKIQSVNIGGGKKVEFSPLGAPFTDKNGSAITTTAVVTLEFSGLTKMILLTPNTGRIVVQ